MNRRQFSQRFGLAAIGATLAPVSKAADASRRAHSEKKEWAHEHLKGLGGLILPSFTPDFKSLDEEAIRHDIRLDAPGRELIKSNFKKAGITPVDRPEEEYMVGKAAYAKGVRASQLSSKPLYA